jgi:hypothetical protein
VSDPFPFSEHEHVHDSAPVRKRRRVVLLAYSLVLVLVSVVATLTITQSGPEDSEDTGPADPSSDPAERPNALPLAFGDQDTVVDTVTIPAGTGGASLLQFDVKIGATPTATSRAAMVSFRVDCRSRDERLEMQSDGTVSTNLFIARGGQVSGQALTGESDEEVQCSLLASAPFIETTDDGLSALPVEAELRSQSTDGNHLLALHRLDDATLMEPGTNRTVLSRRIDEPAALEQMSSTVRLTSCTVIGGSRDAGKNQCQESMTGRESATVRMRVIARWLDAEGDVTSTTTYWDETLAVDYETHHVPWTLRQGTMGERVPDTAEAVVLVVQVESVAGTPVVVHANGTDSIITTSV